MFVGIDELKNPRNPERLKRDLRPCYPLIDRLMESLDSQSASAVHPTLLLNFTESILCPEVQILQVITKYKKLFNNLLSRSINKNTMEPRFLDIILKVDFF